MSAPAAILALLQASDALAALVGDRIYPDQLPDDPQYPAITFQKVGGGEERGATSNPGLMQATYQVSTWAMSRLDAATIVLQVRRALDRKRKVTAGGVPVDDCFYEEDADSSDPDLGVYFNHMSFTIHYREPA